MRSEIEEYITRNAGARQNVDAIIIHADLPTKHVDPRRCEVNSRGWPYKRLDPVALADDRSEP
jgi:hypothetical protein